MHLTLRAPGEPLLTLTHRVPTIFMPRHCNASSLGIGPHTIISPNLRISSMHPSWTCRGASRFRLLHRRANCPSPRGLRPVLMVCFVHAWLPQNGLCLRSPCVPRIHRPLRSCSPWVVNLAIGGVLDDPLQAVVVRLGSSPRSSFGVVHSRC